jgi:integrase
MKSSTDRAAESLNRSIKLTMATAKAAQLPSEGDYILRDPAYRNLGLGLRVYASGVKSWIVQKKLGKRPVRVVLGAFPAINLDQAIKLAQEKALEFARGQDPNQEKRRRQKALDDSKDKEKLTVGVAFLAYEEDKKSSNSLRTISDRQKSRKHLEDSKLWNMPLTDVDGNDLMAEYRRLVAIGSKGSNGGKTQAGAALVWLRAVFRHTYTTKKLVVVDPFNMFNKLQPNWYRANRRKRIVATTEGQLAAWWQAVEKLRAKKDNRSKDAETTADFLFLSILFGTRRNELLPLRWGEVNLEDGTVSFLNTKNGTPHVIPYGSFAKDIFERRHEANQKLQSPSLFVFPSSRLGKDGVQTHLKDPKNSMGEVATLSGVPFSPHDLRRTFATLIEEIEHVSTITIEKVLNHAPSTTAGKHYVVQRMLRLRPLYQRFEDCILTEAGVSNEVKISDAKMTLGTLSVRVNGDQFIASMDTPDGPLEAVGATAKEARLLLQSMI